MSSIDEARPATRKASQKSALGPGALLAASLVVSLLFLTGLGLVAVSSLNSVERLETRFLPAERLASQIVFYDELLTQSARLAATTGDLRWERRYNDAEAELDNVLQTTRDLGGTGMFSLDGIGAVEVSNSALVKAETKALALARAGQTEEATAVLFSPEYEAHKFRYASALEGLRHDIQAGINDDLNTERQAATVALAVCLAALVLSLPIFLWSRRALKHWRVRLDHVEIQRRKIANEIAEGKFRSLTESSTDVAIVIDVDNLEIQYISSAVGQVLRWDVDVLLGSPLGSFVHSDDADGLLRFIDKIVEANGDVVHHQLRMQAVDNNWRIMDVVGRDRRSEGGLGGLVLNAHDVTDLVEAQNHAQELLDLEVQRSQLFRHQAEHDQLTGLLNRSAFQEQLDAALTSEHSVYVLTIDIDGFKEVNDTRGHQAGDRTLAKIASRISEVVRGKDLVARIGGDEFAILVRPTRHLSITHLAERVLMAIGTPIDDERGMVQLSASIGISGPDFGQTDGEAAMTDADLAMYQAKRDGRNRFTFFTPNLREDFMSRIVLKRELEAALIDQQFVVHYQPVWNLETGQIDGAEALVRWQHPTRGLLAPGHFLPLAEEIGLIGEIDIYVLREACRQVGLWRTSGRPWLEGIQVGVNISALDLSRIGLVGLISAELAANSLDSSALVVEITETAMMDNIELARDCLGELSEMGVKLALDDFGTGYSSLSQLQTLEFDVLKIDRAFVIAENDGAQTLLETIVALAKILGMSIVAEGIETDNQFANMQMLGCEYGQGFLMAKPMPPAELLEAADTARAAAGS